MTGLATESAALPAPPAPSLRAVYDEHAEFLWRTLRRLGVPEADVEDAAQEAFVVVHRRLADFEGRSSLRTWLFEIARRVAADWRQRAHVRRETTIDEAPERTTSGDLATELIARKQARAKLDLALAELDDEKREVFVLFELEQLPMQAVADAVGCPLQTAYARLYAARRLVTEAIAAHTAGGSP